MMCLGVFVQTNVKSIRAKCQPTGYVIQENGCWEWVGAVNPQTGYGQTWEDGVCLTPHRMMYQRTKGVIPEGLEIDHLCRNRLCCNPDHLEAVTARVNIARSNAPNAVAGRTGICKRWHPFDEKNTYTRPNGMRMCRTCQLTPTLRARKVEKQRERRRLAREAGYSCRGKPL